MSEQISPSSKLKYGVERVCRAWRFPRSTFYHSKAKPKDVSHCRGKLPKINDDDLLKAIKEDLSSSCFHGEGHRKVHARLKRIKSLDVGRNRVLKVMKRHSLLSPHRSATSGVKAHDGTITTDKPNVMWATDAAKIFTLEDGWIWFFGVIEHWNAECLGWYITKQGSRFSAIEAMTQAIEYVFESTSCEVARGVALRVDNGSQFVSEGFMNQMRYWGISVSRGFVREPETNGAVERFHRTFKEQIVHGRNYHSINDFQAAVAEFIPKYNESWLLEKLNYHSPREARRLYQEGTNMLKQSQNFCGVSIGKSG